MAGDRPTICAAIVNEDLDAIKSVESQVDMYEVRIDLIGGGWRVVAEKLGKPWIACNRRAEEGGSWQGSEPDRVQALLDAVELGSSIVDIELGTQQVESVIGRIKGKAECLLSYHNLKDTPSLEEMKEIVGKQRDARADICKVVTTARAFADNLAVLQLISEYPEDKIISFTMGEKGQISRVLCPLVGGYFAYASIEAGRESADGQLTVGELRKLYEILENG
ncbi:MAG: type I 3-dehydroquinate dehydratase [Dehalococcoidales bacterium]|nr:type I 3-dehydroquinate dehydratase [Dehalococcoidales bacterium]